MDPRYRKRSKEIRSRTKLRLAYSRFTSNRGEDAGFSGVPGFQDSRSSWISGFSESLASRSLCIPRVFGLPHFLPQPIEVFPQSVEAGSEVLPQFPPRPIKVILSQFPPRPIEVIIPQSGEAGIQVILPQFPLRPIEVIRTTSIPASPD